jgi:mRNA interferase HigB
LLEVPIWDYDPVVRVLALSTLRAFWERNPRYEEAKQPLLVWYRYALKADWASPADVKADFGRASILKSGRVVFDIAGNKYRLVVRIDYSHRIVFVRFVGTHSEYDQIDAQTI